MDEDTRRIVKIGVTSLDTAKQRLAGAFRAEPHGNRISFVSIELMWKVLGPKRWDLLKAMTGQGAMSVREAARRVGRDVKAVHGDARALLLAGVLRKTEDGRIEFPYDAIHVDFVMAAA